MQIQIDGQGMDVTPALRDITIKKVKRMQTHFENINKIHITFKINKIRQIADANLSVPGTTISAQAESNDMYETIDLLVRRLKGQLDKYKDKLTNHRD